MYAVIWNTFPVTSLIRILFYFGKEILTVSVTHNPKSVSVKNVLTGPLVPEASESWQSFCFHPPKPLSQTCQLAGNQIALHNCLSRQFRPTLTSNSLPLTAQPCFHPLISYYIHTNEHTHHRLVYISTTEGTSPIDWLPEALTQSGHSYQHWTGYS